MARYLLAAEADKIQDFIFRSSRLREVVGGSQLLLRFCEEVPGNLLPRFGGEPGKDIIISDGGSFRILFDDAGRAREFGAHLAEVYRLATGGMLTVAEPVPVQAGEESVKELRRAKCWRKGWQGQEQFPYMAICASCGTGLAVERLAYFEDEKPQYLCVSCLNKGAEKREDTGEPGLFLKKFYQEVVGKEDISGFDWPGRALRRRRTRKDMLEDIADYDPRRYVAYLLADGNSMGEVFSKCQSFEQTGVLSTGLSGVIRRALAEPAKMLMEKNQLDDRQGFIPVLPLILGGDDLFALLPAPWALDFARCFCREYENEMAHLLECVGIGDALPKPTISAAVVICKSNHPYTLAYEAGQARLKEAKQFSKRKVLGGGPPSSAVNFEVVLGGRLEPGLPDHEVEWKPTLRPYQVNGGEGDEQGLPLQSVLSGRWKLRSVPRKRLVELRNLYDNPDLRNRDKLDKWNAKLEQLVERIAQRNRKQGDAVIEALECLGTSEEKERGYWRRVDRYAECTWSGHGLPDLLEAWDFALRLNELARAYGEGW